jgi:hypothetical protein
MQGSLFSRLSFGDLGKRFLGRMMIRPYGTGGKYEEDCWIGMFDEFNGLHDDDRE